MIALALSCRPSILLADEPDHHALNVTVQIQIILLLRRLQRELGMAVIFVTHDVGVSVEIADRLAVMYAGRFVETGPTEAVIRQPRHPFGRLLGFDGDHGARPALTRSRGTPPSPHAAPLRLFAPRCRYAEDRCIADVPRRRPRRPRPPPRAACSQEADQGPVCSFAPSAAAQRWNDYAQADLGAASQLDLLRPPARFPVLATAAAYGSGPSASLAASAARSTSRTTTPRGRTFGRRLAAGPSRPPARFVVLATPAAAYG